MADPRGDPNLLAIEAYLYLYPLVSMEMTRRQMTNVLPGQLPGRAPMGQFAHISTFPDAEWRAVVRPNFDTLYSLAWLDLSAGPVVVSVPDTHGRYYVLAMYDMWTDAFAAPGWRTSGTAAASYAVTPPGWAGELPAGMAAITAPTSTIWIIGRTQTNGPADYPAVHAIQEAITAVPLASWGTEYAPPEFTPDPELDIATPTLLQVDGMSGRDFFTLAAELMQKYPPHPTDWAVITRSEVIGLRAGGDFVPATLPADVLAAIDAAPAAARALMASSILSVGRLVNGWLMNSDTMGVYGNFYLKRATVAQLGLGANQAEDAIYPLLLADSGGAPLDGDHDYRLHFAREALPPVDAFWSLTMYDGEGFQVANPIDRYAIGDRDPLAYNPDGSLDLYIQRASPGPDREGNWLPSTTGRLGLTLRLYAPRTEALDGRWNPPGVERVG